MPTVQELDVLVETFYSDRAVQTEPWEFFQQLREAHPVFYSKLKDAWLVTGFEEYQAASSYPAFSYNPASACPYHPEPTLGRSRELLRKSFMLYQDDPEHTTYRAAVRHSFSGPTAESWRPRIRRWAEDMVAALPRNEPFDLVTHIALPLPFRITSELLGIPFEDWEVMKTHADSFQQLFIPNPTPEQDATGDRIFDEFAAYLQPFIDERRAGLYKDDLLQEFIAAEDAGLFTRDEIIMFAQILTVGGHETTQGLLTQGLMDLLAHPDQWAALCSDPDLAPQAVEELLRYSGPSRQMQPRYPTADVRLGTEAIPKGATVLVFPMAANRDPRAFVDPERLDIRRTERNVGFGFGPHFCIGASMVRVEAQEFFRALSMGAPDIEIAQTSPVSYADIITLRRPESLQVRIPA